MLEQLQTNIHYNFCQVKLLLLAITHSSYNNEKNEAEGHNERLEFLGDAVLELCVSELLFKNFANLREGELTKIRSRLVSQDSLAALAREIELDKALLLGKGEEGQGGRERDALLSDAFEAVLGAVFLDGGFEAAKKVTDFFIVPRLPAVSTATKFKDYKSLLQENSQKLFQARPVYRVQSISGPEHAQVFEVAVTMPCGTVYTANGTSMKKAEQAAAAVALKDLQK